MAMNRVQFQAGLSMPEFLQRYGTEEQCVAAVQTARWPHGFVCPECGGAASTSFVRGGLRYWQCAACRYQCSLLSGTLFAGTKLPLTRWFLALQLITQAKNNVAALELKRQARRVLSHRLVAQTQDHGGHAPAGGRARARRPGRDR